MNEDQMRVASKDATGPLLFFDRPEQPALNYLGKALTRLRSTIILRQGNLIDFLFRRSIPADYSTYLLPPVPFGREWSDRWHRRTLSKLARPAGVIFTSPDQAFLLDSFPKARKIYYAIDNFCAWSWGSNLVDQWESKIASGVDHVVMVSRGLAKVFREKHRCPEDKVTVSPNAAPGRFTPIAPPEGPSNLPAPFSRVGRPVAGIVGRISSRIRLDWLRAAVEGAPWLNWIFVGEVEMREVQMKDMPNLLWLRNHPRCHFTGRLPYEHLFEWASAMDVGILPYSDRSVNPLGSAMRLFVHLPFGHPILATPGCLQVEEYEPLVSFCRSPEALLDSLERLRENSFDDGLRQGRWLAAKKHTWENRALDLLRCLEEAR